MKVASLFTGCGGLDLGLHQAGHEIILQCECDPGAQQVLRKAFPGVLLVPDVCALDRLPKETELVAAGFPCIDVSRAGLRQGLDGPSTGLVKHVFRLLGKARDEQRPVPWVLLENVEALCDRAHGGPPPVSWVVQQLEQLGYKSWAHRIVCSAGFGVPNRRRRIFILASMHGDARDVLLGQGLHRCMGSCLQSVGGDCWECFDPDDAGGEGEGARAAAMLRCSYALDLGNARSSAGVDVVPTFTTSNARICLLLSSGRFGMLRIEDAERLQGLPPGHTAPCYPISIPGIRQHRVASSARDSDADSSARARFALLGNAVTVQVAEWLGQRLANPYRYKYNMTDNDMPLPKHQQPPSLPESVWQELREVRMDALKGEGAAGGVARLMRGAAAAAAAAAPADESEEEEAAAAAVDGDGGDEVGDEEGGEDVAMEVTLQPGDEDEQPQTAAAAAGAGGGGSGEAGSSRAAAAEAAAAAEGGVAVGDEQQQQPASLTPDKAERGAAAAAGCNTTTITRTPTPQPPPAAAGVGVGVAVTERYGGSRATASWPRAAWYLEGQGRWGLKQASDNPVKSRFVPLGEFINRVGPAPPDVAMVTYLQRLKEQGWNVDRTERKMLMCGVNSIANAKAEANALAGMLGDAFNSDAASSIGRLVWASLPLSNSSNNGSGGSGGGDRPSTPQLPHAAGGGGGGGADSTAAAGGTLSRTGEAAATAAAMPGAASSSIVWWPCEAIDPFNPPLGFELQPEHKLALSLEERRVYLPSATPPAPQQQQGTANNADRAAAGGAAEEGGRGGDGGEEDAAAAGEATGEAAAAGEAAVREEEPSSNGDDNDGDKAAGNGGNSNDKKDQTEQQQQQQPPPGRRKLLLLWFHSNSFEWRNEDEVLPFMPHKQEFKAAAQSLFEAGRLPRYQDWKRAYREAKHCNTIVARAAKLRARQAQLAAVAGPAAAALAAAHMSDSDGNGGGEGGDDSSDSEGECDHRAAVAGRAAKQALAVNLKMPRCKVCETCTQNTGSSSRRCLLVRATAAAAGGHAGAQLAVLGDKAVGADIEVWWPLDQAWYRGVISGYDRLRVRHTVAYEDGDVEIIPLWAPQQRIKLCSQPAQWVAKAAQLQQQREQRQAEVDAARAATRVAGAAGLADLSAVMMPHQQQQQQTAPLTEIEAERRDNIERNRAVMLQMMMGGSAAAAAAAAGGGGLDGRLTPLPFAAAAAAAGREGGSRDTASPSPDNAGAAAAAAGGGGGGGGRSGSNRRKRPRPPQAAAAVKRERGDGGGGTKTIKFAPIPRSQRCGRCHTCINPRLKKACLTVREAVSSGSGGGGGGGYAAANTSTAAAAPRTPAAAPTAAAAAAGGEERSLLSMLGAKRTAACVAECKIKDQLQPLTLQQHARAPAAKKKKPQGGGGGGADSDEL